MIKFVLCLLLITLSVSVHSNECTNWKSINNSAVATWFSLKDMKQIKSSFLDSKNTPVKSLSFATNTDVLIKSLINLDQKLIKDYQAVRKNSSVGIKKFKAVQSGLTICQFAQIIDQNYIFKNLNLNLGGNK